jgi:hypothetical protein
MIGVTELMTQMPMLRGTLVTKVCVEIILTIFFVFVTNREAATTESEYDSLQNGRPDFVSRPHQIQVQLEARLYSFPGYFPGIKLKKSQAGRQLHLVQKQRMCTALQFIQLNKDL